jgi:signal peptidase I
MDIKDIRKAGIDDAEEIKIKKIKTKGKNIDVEEISIRRERKGKVWRLINSLRNFFDKLWNILWKDNSLKGWVFSVIFLFVFIKFIFFPMLSLVTGTSLPLAIVESCSMYHEGVIFYDYDNWWQGHESKYLNYEIEKNNFADFTFKNGFNKGDILFIIKAKPEKLKIGDVIIFNVGKQTPVIHRIISIENHDGDYIFSTMGDNNNGQLSIEKNIREEQLMGKAIFKIAPYVGWGKLVFFEGTKEPSQRGFCKEN